MAFLAMEYSASLELMPHAACVPTLERLGHREALTALLTRCLGVPVDVVVEHWPQPIQVASQCDCRVPSEERRSLDPRDGHAVVTTDAHLLQDDRL